MAEIRVKYYKKRLQLSPIGILTCLLVSLVATQNLRAADSIDITLSGELVSANLDQVDLRQVLQQLTEQGDIKLWISDILQSQTVSARFENQPLDIALRRLLRDLSHALVYDDNRTTVTAIYVLPPGEAPPAAVELRPKGSFDSAQVLQDVLQSGDIPDSIKAALLSQSNANNEENRNDLARQRAEILSRIVDKIEQIGSPSPETMRQLRTMIEQQRALQQ